MNQASHNAPICEKCGAEKSWRLPPKNRNKGWWTCLACNRARARKWHEKNPERSAARTRKWHEENPERAAELCRKWRQENPEKVALSGRKYRQANPEKTAARALKWKKENPEKKAAADRKWRLENPERKYATNLKWSQENPEKILASARKYYLANPEKVAAAARKWGQENPEKVAACTRAWSKANPEKRSSIQHKRRALKRNSLDPERPVTAEIQIERKGLFNGCCFCGSQDKLTLEHVIPLSRGGLHVPENLLGSCRSCNCSKNASPVEEWYRAQPFFSEERWSMVKSSSDLDCS